MSSPAGSSHRTHNFWVVNTRVPLYLLSKMMIASPYDVHRDSKVKLLKWSIGRPSAVYANLSCNWLIHSSFCNSRRPRVICGSSLLLTGYLPFTQELRPHSILLWASCITHLSKLRNSWQGSAPISCTLPHSKALVHWRQVRRNYLFQYGYPWYHLICTPPGGGSPGEAPPTGSLSPPGLWDISLIPGGRSGTFLFQGGYPRYHLICTPPRRAPFLGLYSPFVLPCHPSLTHIQYCISKCSTVRSISDQAWKENH